MPVPPRPIAPELVAEARRLYEQTRVPVDDIAALLGIGTRTLYTRIRKWGWRRRIQRIPQAEPPREDDAPPVQSVVTVPAPACDDTPVAVRIQRAVERELAAIEQIVMRLCPVHEHTEDAERAARVLASLARTLQEVMRLDAKRRDEDTREDDNDRGPADPDEFIRELARRMDEFAGLGKGDRVPDAGEAGMG